MIERVNGGLVKVTGTAALFCGLWVKCLARKQSRCVLSGHLIYPHDWQYRPMTNTSARGQRVRAAAMEKYL